MKTENKQTCVHCKTDPGADPENESLWLGFKDLDTKELVCFKCQKQHYKIKSNGTGTTTYSEYPVMINK